MRDKIENYEELLKRIKAIRASENRFYVQIKEIYKISCHDYQPDSEITKNFFPTVQNKLHLAITGLTASEIILKRVDSNKDDIGLTTWKRCPTGNILQEDVKVAKNYYTSDELERLNDLVSMYLDYAERQAELHKPMYMKDWVDKLDEFLKFNEYDVFSDSEIIRRSLSPKKVEAHSYAITEYKKYIMS